MEKRLKCRIKALSLLKKLVFTRDKRSWQVLKSVKKRSRQLFLHFKRILFVKNLFFLSNNGEIIVSKI